MSHSIRISQHCPRLLRGALAGSGLAIGLSACSGDVVNLGEGQSPLPAYSGEVVSRGRGQDPPRSYSRCPVPPTPGGSVVVTRQAQLDELEGCELLPGDLNVRPLFYPDLRPLHALQIVTGRLSFFAGDDAFSAQEDEIMRSVAAGGWLRSLAGLEGLETVGGLQIVGTAAPDLEPLSGLRALTGDGLLDLEDSHNLRDLAPIGNLDGIRSLVVTGEMLESLAGLRLSENMDLLGASGPRLIDLGATNEVRRVSSALRIWRTGLHDLSALSGLEHVGTLTIEANPELLSLAGLENLSEAADFVHIADNPLLADVSALAGLESAGSLQIVENASLRRIPDFPVLSVQTLAIMSNSVLEQIATFTGELNKWSVLPGVDSRDLPDFTVQNAIAIRPDSLYVAGNPRLDRYTVPAGWRGAQVLVIADNASLLELDLGEIGALDLLSIKANPALERVEHGQLARVDLLSVLGNPALPLATFDDVQTFQREMSSEPIPAPNCSYGQCGP